MKPKFSKIKFYMPAVKWYQQHAPKIDEVSFGQRIYLLQRKLKNQWRIINQSASGHRISSPNKSFGTPSVTSFFNPNCLIMQEKSWPHTSPMKPCLTEYFHRNFQTEGATLLKLRMNIMKGFYMLTFVRTGKKKDFFCGGKKKKKRDLEAE